MRLYRSEGNAMVTKSRCSKAKRMSRSPVVLCVLMLFVCFWFCICAPVLCTTAFPGIRFAPAQLRFLRYAFLLSSDSSWSWHCICSCTNRFPDICICSCTAAFPDTCVDPAQPHFLTCVHLLNRDFLWSWQCRCSCTAVFPDICFCSYTIAYPDMCVALAQPHKNEHTNKNNSNEHNNDENTVIKTP